jgi:hypothetical protein
MGSVETPVYYIGNGSNFNMLEISLEITMMI